MLTLLRHGLEETANQLHGWLDVKMVDKGVEQALRAADFFANTSWRHAYTSDLARATDTAAIVAAKHPGLLPAPAPDLRSLNLGLLQGQPYVEIEDKLNALWTQWRNGDDALRAPEGESWAEYQGRVYPFMFRLQREATNGNVLAVTHSHVCDYAAAVAANGGRPLYGAAMDLVKRFEIQPGNALELVDGKISRINYVQGAPHEPARA